MTEFLRLTGMPQSTPNVATKDIHFVLSVENGKPLACIATFGVAAQIASGLGTSLSLLQIALEQAGSFELVATQKLHHIAADKDPWADRVFLKLTTDQGIPYIFEFPAESALALSDRLKTEGAKPTLTGRA